MPSVATTIIMTTGVTAGMVGVIRVTRVATMTHVLTGFITTEAFTATMPGGIAITGDGNAIPAEIFIITGIIEIGMRTVTDG